MASNNTSFATSCINSTLFFNATLNITLTLNTTTNCTDVPKSSPVSSGWYLGTKPISITLCVIVFLIGLPGNLIVSYVLGIKKRNGSNSGDAFIVCLAVADLLASFCVPFVTIHDIISAPKWYLGKVMCYLLTPLLPVTLIASSWALVLISVDRYRIITKPFSTELSTLNKGLRITMVWLIAIVMNIPFLMSLDTTHDLTCTTKKILSPVGTMVLSVCSAVVGWVIPAIILGIVYHKITKQLRIGEAYHSETQVLQQQIRAENKKVVRMFVVIVCIYLAFTIPFAILQVFSAFVIYFAPKVAKKPQFMALYLLLPNVTALNSCVNPLVYARMHKEVNGHLKIVWKKIKKLFSVSSKYPKSSYKLSDAISNKTCVSQFELSFQALQEDKEKAQVGSG